MVGALLNKYCTVLYMFLNDIFIYLKCNILLLISTAVLRIWILINLPVPDPNEYCNSDKKTRIRNRIPQQISLEKFKIDIYSNVVRKTCFSLKRLKWLLEFHYKFYLKVFKSLKLIIFCL